MTYEELGTGEKLASMRTVLAFHRTRMAADRTLMAIMRTSLSLIGFGFTLYTFVTNFIKREGALGLLRADAPTNFALSLISLGVLLLVLGIANHYKYMNGLRGQRAEFISMGLLPEKDDFPVSLTLISAFLLVLVGVFAALHIMLRSGNFG